jgi:hypothetical protein
MYTVEIAVLQQDNHHQGFVGDLDFHWQIFQSGLSLFHRRKTK